MNDDFKRGFEKKAFIGTLASVISAMVLPSANKRIVQNTFEYSKNNALGVSTAKESKGILGWLAKRVTKDMNTVDKMPKGFRKSFNNLLMKEGPTAVLYSPAIAGKDLGKSLDGAAKEAPFLRKWLGDVTSVDKTKSKKAMEVLAEHLKKAKRIGPKLAVGAAGAGLATAVYSLSDTKRVMNPHHPNYN